MTTQTFRSGAIMGNFRRATCIIFLAAGLLAGCDGLQSCSSTALIGGSISVNWAYSCSATYSSLTEAQYVAITFGDMNVLSLTAEADISFSVETGSAMMTFADPNYQTITLTAVPGKPTRYTGPVRLTANDGVMLEITPIGGAAGTVRYEATFSG